MSETAAAAPAIQINKSIVGGKGAFNPRYFRDSMARWVVWTGGLGVIVALMLIFVYLLAEVMPLFSPAEFKARPAFVLPADSSSTLYVAAEEQAEIGLRVGASGEISFFDLHDGSSINQLRLPIGERSVLRISQIGAERAMLAASLSDGSVLLFQHKYIVTYPNDKRLITPELEFPYGEQPMSFMDQPGVNLAAREERGQLVFAAADAAGQVRLKIHEKQESLMGDTTLEVSADFAFTPAVKPDQLLLEPLLTWLYVVDESGKIAFYRLRGSEAPELIEVKELGTAIQQARYMSGGISIIVAQQDGKISQWFPARKPEGGDYLARVREFDIPGDGQLSAVGVEMRRRGFAAGDTTGRVSVYYATSGRLIHDEQMLDEPIEHLIFNSRANYLMAIGASGKTHGFDVHNEHPEVSLSALWNKVWYESYSGGEWLWQSSAATSDFEPKYSMTPLAVGTLKAAFYAMIFAIPIAILGAIFTANFMSPEMRQVVKPSVEVLAALPSVILGFLAGLWLAPFVETNLPGMFMVLLFLPLSIPIFGYLWMRMPRSVRLRVPPGWEAAMLIPVIALVVWLCFLVAKPVEALIFGGNMQAWMDAELGIGYDQRSALVVGIAMGVAVIPVIFSIAEDAVFTVPKQLTLGSLALGATPWQTLIGVVLPTASPGIFSAVMIGMGRAVGETMIVLMATGNTPVTDFSLFSGMRTFAANIAVEMPESEVGSTHFRLLFLAGLVLFIFTFFFNTLAEVVRQRLRQRYSNL